VSELLECACRVATSQAGGQITTRRGAATLSVRLGIFLKPKTGSDPSEAHAGSDPSEAHAGSDPSEAHDRV
jgi:hypothetical protein